MCDQQHLALDGLKIGVGHATMSLSVNFCALHMYILYIYLYPVASVTRPKYIYNFFKADHYIKSPNLTNLMEKKNTFGKFVGEKSH